MAAQLVLPLESDPTFTREDFVVGPTNSDAIALVESWPHRKVPAAAIYGPAGSGKSHLAAIWQQLWSARRVEASDLAGVSMPLGPIAVEDVDSISGDDASAHALFLALEMATDEAPVLLTGREPPVLWPSVLPDLKSRFSALPAFAVLAPDDYLLAAIARKLFADRQLAVEEAGIAHMLRSLQRTPAAIRAFVTEVDRRAFARSRGVTPALIRELLAERDQSLS
jgi:chromosomal replication initiation ATPase DnaA